MAKSGKKASGKVRIPKTIAGVKIPKDARRAGEALIDKAQSPAGRQAIASGLAMAATAAAAFAAHKTRDTAPQAAREPSPQSARPGEGGTIDPQQVSDAIGHVADAVLGRLFGSRRPG